MMRERTGRLTFIPLSRIHPNPVVFPEAGDAMPLIGCITYDAKLEKAMQQVFGKTCICEDLTVAAAYVRSHNLNTITLQGDKVDRKGALTGGYQSTKSRLDTIKSVKAWSVKYQEDAERQAEVKRSMIQVDQKGTKLGGEIQILTTKRNQAQASRDPLAQEATLLHREREALTERIEKLEGELGDLQADVRTVEHKKVALAEEIRTPLVRELSGEEQEEMATLSHDIDRRQKKVVELSRKKNEVRRLQMCETAD